MKWVLLCIVLVAILAGQTLAESCQTCRGTACQAKEIPRKDCNEYVSVLPFESQLMFNEVDDNAQYGCLNVEYYAGKSLENIRQCVLSNNLDSYCNTLETVIAVKSCNIESSDEMRQKRDAENSNIEPEEEDTTMDTTTDTPFTTTTEKPTTTTEKPTTTTEKPTTTTEKPTTPKNTAVAQFLSISCVVAALLNKLF